MAVARFHFDILLGLLSLYNTAALALVQDGQGFRDQTLPTGDAFFPDPISTRHANTKPLNTPLYTHTACPEGYCSPLFSNGIGMYISIAGGIVFLFLFGILIWFSTVRSRGRSPFPALSIPVSVVQSHRKPVAAKLSPQHSEEELEEARHLAFLASARIDMNTPPRPRAADEHWSPVRSGTTRNGRAVNRSAALEQEQATGEAPPSYMDAVARAPAYEDVASRETSTGMGIMS